MFQDQLDMLTGAQVFMWRPYPDWVFAERAARDEGFQATCRAHTPLVCFEMVEYHMPDRVARQFGFQQGIPIPVVAEGTKAGVDLYSFKAGPAKNWETQHATYIAMWEAREDALTDVAPVPDNVIVPTPEYMEWYNRITVHLLTNPQNRDPGPLPRGIKPIATSEAIFEESNRVMLEEF